MQLKNVNWLGFVSGIVLIAVILLSLYNPWWQLRTGDFGYANFSPLNTTFSFLGIRFSIPLLTAINISCLLVLSISAALMIIYSINPTKEYSKQLLYWSYKKPIIILITFISGLVVLSLLASSIATQYAHIDFTLPIVGTSIVQVPSELLGELSGVQINIAVSGEFQWTFYLALAAAVLCIATRYFYGRTSLTAKPLANTSATSS